MKRLILLTLALCVAAATAAAQEPQQICGPARVVDGDGIAAFINHSCDPNCESDEIRGRVIIRAIRKIAPGEELAYDYCLYDGDPDDPALCHCGAKNCRGSMYSEKEIRKRRTLVKNAKSKKP